MDILYITSYLAIMISAGILGGTINYFIHKKEIEPKKQKPSQYVQCVTIGIGASFIVPLFLKIIQSDLIKHDQLDSSKIFVFLGFCLLAAIYSRKFLTTVSEKILKTAEEAKEKAKEIEKKLDSKEIQHSVDARVLVLLEQLLIDDPDPEAPEISFSELKEQIKLSSNNVKALLFSKARVFRLEHFKETDKIRRLMPVFEALIESDQNQSFHRNHAQLAYILKDKEDPDLERAYNELTLAIKIRERLNIGNFSAYEFNRAICQIQLDKSFIEGKSSTKEIKDLIIKDLKIAAKNKYWKSVIGKRDLKDGSNTLSRWLKINKIDSETLA